MKKNDNLITKNKKAFFDYEMIESWEAWIILKWHETKSIRHWHVNLKWAFLSIMSGELYLKFLHITPWKALSNRWALETDAPRKVLLHKKTIEYLTQKSKEWGYTIIPTELYFKWSLIKVRVALAKWKKAHQKKQVLRERAMDKAAKVALKKYI